MRHWLRRVTTFDLCGIDAGFTPGRLDAFSMPDNGKTHVLYTIIAILFVVSCLSYSDRVALSLAGAVLNKEIGMNPMRLGYLFSGFSWAYVLVQLPSGDLLDRLGSKNVYGISIIVWSLCAVLVGFAGYWAASAAFTAIFVLRLVSGFAQAPVFPGNGRVVASWFPTRERGRASAIFNSSQYFTLLIFAPVYGWIIHVAGWKSCFWSIGAFGGVLAILWFYYFHNVKQHPNINFAEISYIEKGGGLVNVDIGGANTNSKGNTLNSATIQRLLSQRMLVGVYIGQDCITTLT
jgi:ACS family glucarate transporter-like MFS transporter